MKTIYNLLFILIPIISLTQTAPEIEWDNTIGGNDRAQIEIFNVIGEEIYSANTEIINGGLNQQINLPFSTVSGVYIVEIKTDERNFIQSNN
jgi:hypothetical protein